MVLEHLEIKRPKPVCVDIISEDDLEEYFPIGDKGNIIDKRIVKFIKKRGYVYDLISEEWYILLNNGLYFMTTENMVKTEIFHLLTHNTPEDLHVTSNYINSLLTELRALLNTHVLYKEFDNYISNTQLDYDIPEGYDGELIPVKNGIINTSNMELLPHCGYYFAPYPYNFEYYLFPQDDLYSCMCFEDYLQIIDDPPTLYYLLWWVGMVLFAPKPEQMVLILYGAGGTGKSSIAGAISQLLGDFRVSKSGLDILTNPHGTATLENKKLNISSEIDNGNYTGLAGIIKNISGEEYITVNPKNKPAKTIKNTVNLMIIGNTFIECDMSDPGLMRRIKVIECYKKVKWEDNIPNLLKDNEHLNWLFNAALDQYNKNKGVDPETLVSLKMRDALNNVYSYSGFNAWVLDRCGSLDYDIVQDVLKGEIYSDLYTEYYRFVDEYGCKTISKKDFGEKLRINYRLKYSSRGGKNVMVKL